MKAAFQYIDRRVWQGGYNYLLSMLSAISTFDGEGFNAVLYCGDDVPSADLAAFTSIDGVTVHSDPRFGRASQRRRIIDALLLGRDRVAEEQFNKDSIDVVFENAFFFGSRFGVPVVSWLPDFQHLVLPHFFTLAQRLKREFGFRRQLARRGTVVVSSNDAAATLEQHYPSARARIEVLQFAVTRPAITSDELTQQVLAEYDISTPFFFLPNQFYAHKNHKVVLRALESLASKGRTDTVVVATGNTKDPRANETLAGYQEFVRTRGLQSQFRILGSVPYEHVVALMRATKAVINPSYFEGWSTTVEEAKALSRSMVLSDLAVHREQAGDHAQFFNPDNPDELAGILMNFDSSGAGQRSEAPDYDELRRAYAVAAKAVLRRAAASAQS